MDEEVDINPFTKHEKDLIIQTNKGDAAAEFVSDFGMQTFLSD